MSKEKLESPELDYSQDAGAGLENLNAGNMALPFLSILQPLSPQVQEGNPKNVEGAKPGMVFNTVTGQLYDVKKKPITFIVCGFKQAWPEWKDRNKGGGFVKMHPTRDILAETKPNDRGKPVLPNGNFIVDTAYYFGVILNDDGTTENAVISMSSSQWKVARNWNTLLMKDLLPSGQVSPAYRCKWALSTVVETKDNNTWYMWKVLKIGPVVDKKVYELSRGFSQQVRENPLLLANKSQEQNQDDPDAY